MGSRDRRARRGRPSLLEEGWVQGRGPDDPNGLTWTIGSPIGDFLTYIGVGLSQRESCDQAKVNRSTITGLLEAARVWTPADPTPSAVWAIEDPQGQRLAAFAAEYQARRGQPKVVALASLSAAAQSDWRAADRLLVRLYPEMNRLEVTGREGGPIEVDASTVAEKLRSMLTNMVDAERDEEAARVNLAGAAAGEVNVEERAVAPVSFPSGEVATPGQLADEP